MGLHSSGIGAAFLGSAQQNPNKVPVPTTEHLVLLCFVLLASTDQLPDPGHGTLCNRLFLLVLILTRVAFCPVLRLRTQYLGMQIWGLVFWIAKIMTIKEFHDALAGGLVL